jgi:DnaK suppressor protein
MDHDVDARTGHNGFAAYEPAEGEAYMNPRQQAHFREILNAWRRELMEEVDRTVGHMKVDSVHCPDPNDRATQESDMGMELRTRERERKLLNKIDKTLKKLDENEYGYCESCGVEIGIRRLEARPTADLCIDCKTRQEELERLQG